MLRDTLDQAAYDCDIQVENFDFVDAWVDGLCVGNHVYLSRNIRESGKRNRVLAHELEHAQGCPHNLLQAPAITQRKFELLADRAVMAKYLPIDALQEQISNGMTELSDLAQHFEIDEAFLVQTIRYYQSIGKL